MTIEQLPPHNREAEEAVLGSLLIDPDAIYDVATFLKAEMFHSVSNKQVYEAIMRLYDRREDIDTLTVLEELRRHDTLVGVGGEAYVVGLVSAVPTSLNAAAYGRIVQKTSVRRDMLIGAGQIARLAYDEEIDTEQAVADGQAIAARWEISGVRTGMVKAGDVGRQMIEDYKTARSGKPQDILRLPWRAAGHVKFKRGNFVVLGAARPGMGKSSMIIQTAHIFACQKYKVMLYPYEATPPEVMARIYSHRTGIAENRLTYDSHSGYDGSEFVKKVSYEEMLSNLTDDEFRRYEAAVNDTSDLPLEICEHSPTIQQLVSDVAKEYLTHGDKLVVMIDYLQLVRASGYRPDDEVGIVSEVSRQLKALAKNYGIWVFASAQLGRELEKRQNKRPTLPDLRWSGQIEQDADIVISLYRDEYYTGQGLSEFNGIIEAGVLKYRGGQAGGVINLKWIGEQVMIDDL